MQKSKLTVNKQLKAKGFKLYDDVTISKWVDYGITYTLNNGVSLIFIRVTIEKTASIFTDTVISPNFALINGDIRCYISHTIEADTLATAMKLALDFCNTIRLS